jgi:hypothetical protein
MTANNTMTIMIENIPNAWNWVGWPETPESEKGRISAAISKQGLTAGFIL